jgi:hypothetical protein
MPRRCDDAILNSLDSLLAAMKANDLPMVIEIANALSLKERRPVIESSVCIGFNRGYQFEILDWLANSIGTLEISKYEWGTKLRSVKHRRPGLPQ